jgi:hypothetical protein
VNRLLSIDSYSPFPYNQLPKAINFQHHFRHCFFSPEHPNRSIVVR